MLILMPIIFNYYEYAPRSILHTFGGYAYTHCLEQSFYVVWYTHEGVLSVNIASFPKWLSNMPATVEESPSCTTSPALLGSVFFFQISILMSVHCWWCVHCVALMTNEVGHMFTLACLHLWGGAYFLMLLFSFDSFGFSLQLLSILYMWVFKLMNVLEYSFPLCEWSSQAPDGMFNEREFIIL